MRDESIKGKVKEKTRRAYNKIGSDYDSWYWFKKARELRARLTNRTMGILKRELGKPENLKEKPRILDLCCGTGHLVAGLSAIGVYTGVDFAQSMIEHCKKTYPSEQFVLADAEKLPFKDASFDVVVCFWSFHHIIYPGEVLDEIARVLKPCGLVLIVTFKDAKLNFAAKLADWVSGAYWGYTTKRYSKNEMQRLMEKRFKSIAIEIFPEGFSLLNMMGIRFLVAYGRK